LQMIFRRSQKGLYTRQHYLSGFAHPTVYDADRLAPERMIAMAAALKADEVPPMVRLKVESEDFSDSAGLGELSERLFTTPSAIARIWRSESFSQNMAISAEKTEDPNGRDLVFEWVLLRGDPAKVRITSLNAANSRARISLDWQGERRIDPAAERRTNRVDIGVFASNGVHDSAPAFVSISFPQHHSRTYRPVGDERKMRLTSIDYAVREESTYFDPLLHWTADWQDEFEYGSDGDLVGWKRFLPYDTLILLDGGGRSDQAPPSYEIKIRKGLPQLYMKSPDAPQD